MPHCSPGTRGFQQRQRHSDLPWSLWDSSCNRNIPLWKQWATRTCRTAFLLCFQTFAGGKSHQKQATPRPHDNHCHWLPDSSWSLIPKSSWEPFFFSHVWPSDSSGSCFKTNYYVLSFKFHPWHHSALPQFQDWLLFKSSLSEQGIYVLNDCLLELLGKTEAPVRRPVTGTCILSVSSCFMCWWPKENQGQGTKQRVGGFPVRPSVTPSILALERLNSVCSCGCTYPLKSFRTCFPSQQSLPESSLWSCPAHVAKAFSYLLSKS